MRSTTFSRSTNVLRTLFVAGVISSLPSVRAASAACVSGWEWSYNSEGQNPCEIAGDLQASCLGFSTYELGPLNSSTGYLVPRLDDPSQQKCSCNSVIYNLYQACTACQNVEITKWDVWEPNCTVYYVGQYPLQIPEGTSVPAWAYLDFDGTGNFDPVLAKETGSQPEHTSNSTSSNDSVNSNITGDTVKNDLGKSGSKSGKSGKSSGKKSTVSKVVIVVLVVVAVIVILLAIAVFCVCKKVLNRKKGFSALKAFGKERSAPGMDVPGYEKHQDLYDPWEGPRGSVDAPATTYRPGKDTEYTQLTGVN